MNSAISSKLYARRDLIAEAPAAPKPKANPTSFLERPNAMGISVQPWQCPIQMHSQR
jgi:hypothetical protein